MVKTAAKKAGMWFFGVLTVCMVFLSGNNFKNLATWDHTLKSLLISGVVAGWVFFYDWYQSGENQRK